jgi:uncharacterized protein YcbK (DUF882 family)
MSSRGVSLLAFAVVIGTVLVALALWPRLAPAAQKAQARAAATKPAASTLELAVSPPRVASRFTQLAALHVENQTTRQSRELKLYDASGQLDESAALQLDELLCDARRPKQHETTRLNRRTLQLLFKAAYHFEAYEVEVVSAYRKPGRRREGPHGNGDAIDFRLRGVKAWALAAYLRQLPRTGVGVYTHPKTQYVHLDSREHSFHWLDASPPGRHWRERSIGSPHLEKLDALFSPAADWP